MLLSLAYVFSNADKTWFCPTMQTLFNKHFNISVTDKLFEEVTHYFVIKHHAY